MRVVVGLPWSLDWSFSGLRKQLVACFNAVHDAGVDLQVHALGGPRQPDETRFPLEILPVRPTSHHTSYTPLLNSVAFAQRFARSLEGQDYDLLHCFNSTAFFLEREGYLYQTANPTYAYIMEVVSGEFPDTPKYRGFQRYFATVADLEREEYARAGAIVCLSEFIKQQIVHYHEVDPSRIEVIPNGVSPAEFPDAAAPAPPPPLASKMKIVLFPGTIRVMKGFQYLVEAMEIVRKAIPEAALFVTGKFHPDELEMFHPLVQARREAAGIVLVGFLARDQFLALLRRAAVCCLPCLYGVMENALLEAIGHGIPIVATRASGIPHINRVGIEVPPKDPAAIAEALLTLLSDEKTWRVKQTNARACIKEFYWTNLAERFVRLYEKTCEAE